MAGAGDSRSFWKDDEIVVDRDGIPHFSGMYPHLMREYRRRVLFAYGNLEGSGDDEEKEKKSLAKKRSRFARKLLDALHGEAFRCCQDLLLEADKLKEPKGYEHILKSLQQIEKAGVIRKTEAFDQFFDKCYRRRGQTIDSYLRQRKQDWNDLQDIAEGVQMSDDLLAYFTLKNIGLSKEDKRQILLANQSTYNMEGIEKALRVSFFDVHEKEKKDWGNGQPKGRQPKGYGKRQFAHLAGEEDEGAAEEAEYPEDPEYEDGGPDSYAHAAEGDDEAEGEDGGSDEGASGDDAVYEAYATYKESRQKLRDVQRARGFLKPKDGGGMTEERRQAVAREKSRTRCMACGKLGHWAGDPECGKGGSKGRQKPGKGRGGKGPKGKPKGGGKAYVVSERPMLFSLDADEDGDGWCNMVLGGAEQASSEEGEMDQDDGKTALDERRKFRTPVSDDSAGWEEVDVPPPFPGVGHTTLTGALAPEMDLPKTAKKEEKTKQDVVVPVPKDKIENIRVTSFLDVRPRAIQQLRVRELQADLERWGAAVSGTKAELLVRLGRLYSGDPVLKKGCTTRYVQLVEVRGHSRGYHSGTAGPTSSSSAAPQASTKPPEATEARPTTTPTASATGDPLYISKLRAEQCGQDGAGGGPEDWSQGAGGPGGRRRDPRSALRGVWQPHGSSSTA